MQLISGQSIFEFSYEDQADPPVGPSQTVYLGHSGFGNAASENSLSPTAQELGEAFISLLNQNELPNITDYALTNIVIHGAHVVPVV